VVEALTAVGGVIEPATPRREPLRAMGLGRSSPPHPGASREPLTAVGDALMAVDRPALARR